MLFKPEIMLQITIEILLSIQGPQYKGRRFNKTLLLLSLMKWRLTNWLFHMKIEKKGTVRDK
jgi:hypothetical protein